MKLLLHVVLWFSIPMFSQVGIGTTDPTASLDINGNLRIRTIQEETEKNIAADSILVISRDGTVNRVTSRNVYESNIKTAVRGHFTGTGNINITLGSNVAIVPFSAVAFDTNNEFDIATNTFTAKQDGIYQVYAQINSSSGLAFSPNYGLRILKGSTVIAQQNFANINLAGINLTPPVRNVQTLVQLSEGETISFQLFTDLLSVNLLRSNADSYFTIHQIR